MVGLDVGDWDKTKTRQYFCKCSSVLLVLFQQCKLKRLTFPYDPAQGCCMYKCFPHSNINSPFVSNRNQAKRPLSAQMPKYNILSQSASLSEVWGLTFSTMWERESVCKCHELCPFGNLIQLQLKEWDLELMEGGLKLTPDIGLRKQTQLIEYIWCWLSFHWKTNSNKCMSKLCQCSKL